MKPAGSPSPSCPALTATTCVRPPVVGISMRMSPSGSWRLAHERMDAACSASSLTFMAAAYNLSAMHTLLALALLPAALTTEAERSGFTRTGRYDEVERLCPAFAAAHPRQV